MKRSPVFDFVSRELRGGGRWKLLQCDARMDPMEGLRMAIGVRRQGFGVALLEIGILVDTSTGVDA